MEGEQQEHILAPKYEAITALPHILKKKIWSIYQMHYAKIKYDVGAKSYCFKHFVWTFLESIFYTKTYVDPEINCEDTNYEVRTKVFLIHRVIGIHETTFLFQWLVPFHFPGESKALKIKVKFWGGESLIE